MSKYKNIKTVVDGIKFDSKREAKRYQQLKLLERSGVISELELQPKFPITIGGVEVRYPNGRHLTYIADFKYWFGEDERYVIEDAKGKRTEGYIIKRALMLAMGYTITEV